MQMGCGYSGHREQKWLDIAVQKANTPDHLFEASLSVH